MPNLQTTNIYINIINLFVYVREVALQSLPLVYKNVTFCFN